MHKYIILSALVLSLGSCASKSPRNPSPIMTEKDYLMLENNSTYSDATIIGLGALLVRETRPQISFEDEVRHIEGVEIDEATGRLIVHQHILFDFNSDEVKKEAIRPLSEIVEAFNNLPKASIQIYGYTDNLGSESYNLALSERRANSVAQVLAELGIHEDKIEAIGRGERDPIASNDSEYGRSRNRRVEFKVLQ